MSTAFVNGLVGTSGFSVWVGARAAVAGTGTQAGASFVWGSGADMSLPYTWSGRFENCLLVKPASSSPLMADYCSIPYPYVCEYEP